MELREHAEEQYGIRLCGDSAPFIPCANREIAECVARLVPGSVVVSRAALVGRWHLATEVDSLVEVASREVRCGICGQVVPFNPSQSDGDFGDGAR
jgi:hypothetical protein